MFDHQFWTPMLKIFPQKCQKRTEKIRTAFLFTLAVPHWKTSANKLVWHMAVQFWSGSLPNCATILAQKPAQFWGTNIHAEIRINMRKYKQIAWISTVSGLSKNQLNSTLIKLYRIREKQRNAPLMIQRMLEGFHKNGASS